ncbi:MAG: hypothetical protein ACI8QD_000819 [Cyclobacteriaceae bacterium]
MPLVLILLGFVTLASEKTKASDGDKSKVQTSQQETTQATDAEIPQDYHFYAEDDIKNEAINISSRSSNPVIIVDTTNSSISKYNYLFYFIYKYKYETRLGLDQIEKLITD